jgi:hypothetical protein
MNEISYITARILKTLAEHPSRAVTALEYACALTLLMAIITDSLLRRRSLVREKSVSEIPSRTARK